MSLVDLFPDNARGMRCVCGHLHGEHNMLEMTDCAVVGCPCSQWGLDDMGLFQLPTPELAFDKWPSELSMSMHHLATCLRDAGALCAAFTLGRKSVDVESSETFFVLAGVTPPIAWHPGCGSPAPRHKPAPGGGGW